MLSLVNMLPALGAVCLIMAAIECSPCDTAPNVDGCSIPGGLSFWYKEVFESACNKHDVCYECGVDHDVSRSQCDDRFLSNMKSTCETHEEVTFEWWCKGVANMYYLAVNAFGGSEYVNSLTSWCNEAWVPPCMN